MMFLPVEMTRACKGINDGLLSAGKKAVSISVQLHI